MDDRFNGYDEPIPKEVLIKFLKLHFEELYGRYKAKKLLKAIEEN